MAVRYEVFISSTYNDLKKERLAAINAVLKTGNFPVGMEYFDARSKSQWDIIKKSIDSCDYYILIVGYCYGSTVKDEEISYTEKEYNYAKSIDKPILAFIKKDNVPTPPSFIEKDLKKVDKLKQFKTNIEDNLVDFWEDEKDLQYQIATSLEKEIKENPGLGWVRAKKPVNKSDDKLILSSGEEFVLKFLQEHGDVSITELSKRSDYSKYTITKTMDSLNKLNLVEKNPDYKWTIINNKDDYQTYLDYYDIIKNIMNDLGIIKICDCGDHYWESDVPEDVNEIIIEELKKRDMFKNRDKDIILQAIKTLIDEADPTNDECPNCGFKK